MLGPICEFRDSQETSLRAQSRRDEERDIALSQLFGSYANCRHSPTKSNKAGVTSLERAADRMTDVGDDDNSAELARQLPKNNSTAQVPASVAQKSPWRTRFFKCLCERGCNAFPIP